jgi:hypothetical protein
MDGLGQAVNGKLPRRRSLCLALSLSLAAGCSHTQSHVPPEDPLHRTPIAVPADPNAPPPPSAAPHQGGSSAVQPIPNTFGATNNATLAANTSLPGARPLAIPERAANEPVPGQLTSTPPSNFTPAAPIPGPPRVLEVPADTSALPGAAVQPASSWSTNGAAPTAAPAAATGVTTDNFARLLAERGYTLQNLRQSSLAQGVHVTCIASYQNSATQDVFEVTAADFDAAGQAILREATARQNTSSK